MEKTFEKTLIEISNKSFGKGIDALNEMELYSVLGQFINEKCLNHEKTNEDRKTAAYFSAEFLIGTLLRSNLLNLGITELTEKTLNDFGRNLSELDMVEDYAFGNGGLGRLAACFLDSAASNEIPLDGYGIRYKYGLFKQSFDKNGEQVHSKDNWQISGDPFAMRVDNERVKVSFLDYSVYAVPYDYFVIGYKFKSVNRLRLYEAESCECDKEKADELFSYLYPDDTTYEGKRLRLRQQYFFTSASIQNIINRLGIDKIEERIKIQLNDTHPVIAIAEFVRLCMLRGITIENALDKAGKIFAYTNHTVMPEALEKWDCELFKSILPDVFAIIEQINSRLMMLLADKSEELKKRCAIIEGEKVHMANLACFVCSDINGVAKIHSDIIAKSTLSQWYSLFPSRFSNKTNGISQRRWLALANPDLYEFLCKLCDSDLCVEIGKIERLASFKDDIQVLEKIKAIRYNNKKKLCEYVRKTSGIELNSESVFFVHVKRVHEYKRQLLCAFLIVYLYNALKKGDIRDLPPMTFIFAGKAAQSYEMAKKIIKFINKIADKINTDDEMKDKLQVVFLENYNVSLAEKIIPAADISLQISQAGTEASGTGNMKLMMNGAVTLGTYDGANIEITQFASKGNNYIFGLDETAVNALKKEYEPKKFYEGNKDLKTVVDALIDGSFGKTEEFIDIYDSLLSGSNPDRFMVLADFMSFCETVLLALKDYEHTNCFFKKAVMNIASSAFFSSDRTVNEYAENIWFS